MVAGWIRFKNNEKERRMYYTTRLLFLLAVLLPRCRAPHNQRVENRTTTDQRRTDHAPCRDRVALEHKPGDDDDEKSPHGVDDP